MEKLTPLYGTDVKLLQYKKVNENKNHKTININNLISETYFNKNGESINTLMINIVKDKERYHKTVNEFQKLSINNFVHLKATYWKDKDIFVNDINYIFDFMRKYNSNIPSNITIDEFSGINDKNILIQDGPLACYVSHVRALIYGYTNFQDYTIIVEDDIYIENTENIEKYVTQIPNDWDIIFLGCIEKENIMENSVTNNSELIKMKNPFHSSHLYIIKNECIPFILKNLYPIYDQVDVIISDMRNTLNIYNIKNTAFQRIVSTNTQNNLHTILTTPNYFPIRYRLRNIESGILFFCEFLLSNSINNDFISYRLINDTLYSNMVTIIDHKRNNNSMIYCLDNEKIKKMEEYAIIYNNIFNILLGCIKNENSFDLSAGILDNMICNILSFDLHGKMCYEYNENYTAYDYGSTCNVYLLKNNNIIIKKYNDKLRWMCDNHDDSDVIFNKELNYLIKHDYYIGCDKENKIIKLKYLGKSLFNNFYLPNDYEQQIRHIFDDLTEKEINYPEFNLNNICVLNNKITFIDFGLADNNYKNNNNNCEIFLELLDKFNKVLKESNNINLFRVTYKTFINNVKIHNIEKYSKNIF